MQKDKNNATFKWTGIIKTASLFYTTTTSIPVFADCYITKSKEILKKDLEKTIKENPESITAKELVYYTLAVKNIGWINCDRFYNVPKDEKVNMLVRSQGPVKLIFKELNGILESSRYNSRAEVFDGIPKNKPVTLFSIAKKGEKIFLALQDELISNTPIQLQYKEVSYEQIQEAMKIFD